MTKTEKKTARKVAKARREERRRCVNIACAFLHILTSEEERGASPAAYSNGTVRRIVDRIKDADK